MAHLSLLFGFFFCGQGVCVDGFSCLDFPMIGSGFPMAGLDFPLWFSL